MQTLYRALSRRGFLTLSSALAGGLLVSGRFTEAQTLPELEVASAGSVRPILDGPIRTAVAEALKLDLHTHAQGADAVAQSILEGRLQADLFIPVTASPMQTLMSAGKVDSAVAIARTELVLVYSPKSRFASQLDAAAKGQANWWEVLQQPGFRIGRGDPSADPGARATYFAMMLAARKYNQKDLAEKVLGAPVNPQQILSGVQDRLAIGELDGSTSYKITVQHSHLPYITLPEDINLSRDDVRRKNPDVHLTVGEKTFHPESLIFYAGQMKNAKNSVGAAAFLQWLQGRQAQLLFRDNGFAAAGEAQPLRA